MGSASSKYLERQGDPKTRCIAMMFDSSSKLVLLEFNGDKSNSVKATDKPPRGIVTVKGAAFTAAGREILRIYKTGKSTPIARVDEEFDSNTQVLSLQERIYVIQQYGKSMFRFDPYSKNLKENLPGLTHKLGLGFCSCASSECIYVIGGFGTENVVLRYDPIPNSWTKISDMKYGRDGSAAAVMNDKAYVVGGRNNPPSEFYDPQSSVWSEISRMNVLRMRFSLCVNGSKLYAVGGDGKVKTNGARDHTIEVYDGKVWRKLTKFETKDLTPNNPFIYACIWPGEDEIDPNIMELGEDMMYENIRNAKLPASERLRLAFSEIVGTLIAEGAVKIGVKGEYLRMPGVNIRIPPGAVNEDKAIKFSARSVTDLEFNLIDVTPRIQISLVEFLRPITVKLETCISAPSGETIPVTMHQRDRIGEEWKKVGHLCVGDRNEVEFQLERGGETKVTIKYDRWNRKVRRKLQKKRRNLAENMKVKLHARVDFFVHQDTETIIAVFSRDGNAQMVTKKELFERGFIPFSVAPHKFIVNMGSSVSPKLTCLSPQECKMSETIYPYPSFTASDDFLVGGTITFYFELLPDPPEGCKKVQLLYECRLDGELDHHIPLAMRWPPIYRKEGRMEDITEVNWSEPRFFKQPVEDHPFQQEAAPTHSEVSNSGPSDDSAGAVGGPQVNDSLDAEASQLVPADEGGKTTEDADMAVSGAEGESRASLDAQAQGVVQKSEAMETSEDGGREISGMAGPEAFEQACGAPDARDVEIVPNNKGDAADEDTDTEVPDAKNRSATVGQVSPDDVVITFPELGVASDIMGELRPINEPSKDLHTHVASGNSNITTSPGEDETGIVDIPSELGASDQLSDGLNAPNASGSIDNSASLAEDENGIADSMINKAEDSEQTNTTPQGRADDCTEETSRAPPPADQSANGTSVQQVEGTDTDCANARDTGSVTDSPQSSDPQSAPDGNVCLKETEPPTVTEEKSA